MTLRQAVESARAHPGARPALLELYTDLAREIDAARPRCDASGRCCRFDAFGHRLYVTTLELAVFTAQLPTAPTKGRLPLFPDPAGCIFQRDNLCSVHDIRPFGCRMFFCDPDHTSWMTDTYERFHTRLTDLHRQLGIDYRYVEWRAALAELGLTSHTAL